MTETQVRLAAEEQTFLTELLERTLKSTLVEEHRTRKPSYREAVIRQERLIAGILEKLRAESSGSSA